MYESCQQNMNNWMRNWNEGEKLFDTFVNLASILSQVLTGLQRLDRKGKLRANCTTIVVALTSNRS